MHSQFMLLTYKAEKVFNPTDLWIKLIPSKTTITPYGLVMCIFMDSTNIHKKQIVDDLGNLSLNGLL